ncbi:MAG: hypothetical protein U5R06_11465 [candidate division KSB1 bacterium]|nr:hypothetical protein [candidate division KSB1 bacterium]
MAAEQSSVDAVCPPFFLRDESGAIINPVQGVNADKPYSPRQTCGGADCHDYDLITQGYHFTQGAGEEPASAQVERCLWVSSPGNYGGSWCSPAPLYRYLSPKENTSSKEMEMTSFSAFIGIWRETWLKPVLYIGLFLLLMIPLVLAGEFVLRWIYGPHPMPKILAYVPMLLVVFLSVAVLLMMSDRQLVHFILPSRFWLDSNHFAIAMVILLAGILALVYRLRNVMQNKSEKSKQRLWINELVTTFIVLFVSGVLMLVKIPGLVEVNRFAYSVFDVALLFILMGTLVTFYTQIIKNAIQSTKTA